MVSVGSSQWGWFEGSGGICRCARELWFSVEGAAAWCLGTYLCVLFSDPTTFSTSLPLEFWTSRPLDLPPTSGFAWFPSLHCAHLRVTALRLTALHFTALHVAALDFTSPHCTSLHFILCEIRFGGHGLGLGSACVCLRCVVDLRRCHAAEACRQSYVRSIRTHGVWLARLLQLVTHQVARASFAALFSRRT